VFCIVVEFLPCIGTFVSLLSPYRECYMAMRCLLSISYQNDSANDRIQSATAAAEIERGNDTSVSNGLIYFSLFFCCCFVRRVEREREWWEWEPDSCRRGLMLYPLTLSSPSLSCLTNLHELNLPLPLVLSKCQKIIQPPHLRGWFTGMPQTILCVLCSSGNVFIRRAFRQIGLRASHRTGFCHFLLCLRGRESR